MQIAFVIPAHNEEALLGQCLQSVLDEVARSGLKDVEIVVVDNASTDRTSEVAGGFAGVKVVHEAQKGLGHARASGFANCTAPLVANIDADTIVPEGWLSVVVDEFSRDPKLVCLSGPYIYYDLSWSGQLASEVFYWATKAVYWLSRFVFKTGSVVQGGNFVVMRSAMESIGGYDRSISFYGEDTDIAVRLNRIGGVKWTFRLRMKTSGRRLEKQGIVKTGFTYVLNYISVTFRGRPATHEHTDYRN